MLHRTRSGRYRAKRKAGPARVYRTRALALVSLTEIASSPAELEALYPLTEGTHFVTEPLFLTGTWDGALHLTVQGDGYLTLNCLIADSVEIVERHPGVTLFKVGASL